MSIYVDIEKQLGSFSLKVHLEAGDETIALLGASGCGKSMTLKCIAGIEMPDRGRIVIDGVRLFDSTQKINLSPQARHAGLMFQNYALFPNMTVLQNISTGANREKNKTIRENSVLQMMERFELTHLSSHYPHQLSGGQQQRVALARILVSSPNILMLDEPFSALDSHLRFRMEQEVRNVIRSFGKTVLLVSHDRDEVYRMADSIAIMNEGHIDTFGKRKYVFEHPFTKNGALLTGCKNISLIKKMSSKRIYALDWGIELAVNSLSKSANYIGIRMHDLHPGSGVNSVHCKVIDVIENPFSVTIMLQPVDKSETIPIGWETDKSIWSNICKKELDICLPPESLMLLEDNIHVDKS